MTKSELVNAIVGKSGLTKEDAGKALQAAIETISEALCRNERVTLIRFGTFETRFRNEREGFNPFAQESITIPARFVPAFRPSRVLKDAVRQDIAEG